jgi:hypothetical protein
MLYLIIKPKPLIINFIQTSILIQYFLKFDIDIYSTMYLGNFETIDKYIMFIEKPVTITQKGELQGNLSPLCVFET